MASVSALNSSSGTGGNKDFGYYAASVIGVLIVFGFGYLPPIEPITPIGMKIVGIFLGMIFLWSFVSILWPSLLGIVALFIFGTVPPRQVLYMSFGDAVPMLILFAMVLFGAIQHAGVTRYISRWFLTRKIINGKPVVFSFIFIYATYVLAALSANLLPALLFMWAILYSVLEDVGYKKGDKYTAVMVVGTLFGAISGQASKPFTGSALMIAGAYEKAANARLDYLHYMLFGFIMSSLGIALYALLIKLIFRPDMSKMKNINIERFQREQLPPMDARQRIMMCALLGYLILVLLPSILPTSLPGVDILARIGPLGVVILFVVALSLFKIDNKPVLDFKEIAGKYVVWDVFFLVCMAMAISTALTEDATGVTGFLKNALTPLFGGRSLFAFAAILVAFSIFITQFANNAVMGVLLMPVIKIFSEQSGGNFEALATLIIFALHVAIVTPAASPYAAILYGNKDWVSQGDVIKYGSIICVMGIVMYMLVGIPLANMIY